MNELILNKETMTVYEIAKLVQYMPSKSHRDAMNICKTLMLDANFKSGDSPISLKSMTYGDNGQTTLSYALNKRQSFALASRLNVNFLMCVIDRWQELEGSKPEQLDPIAVARRNLELTIQAEELKVQVIIAENKAIARLEKIGNHLAGSTIGKLGNNVMFNSASKILATNLNVDLGHNKLMQLCRDNGWLMSGGRSRSEWNMPTQAKIHHFMIKLFHNPDTNQVTTTPVLKPSGMVALAKLIPLWVTEVPTLPAPTPPALPSFTITHDCKDESLWVAEGWTRVGMIEAGHAI